jgi:hypothetical protein
MRMAKVNANILGFKLEYVGGIVTATLFLGLIFGIWAALTYVGFLLAKWAVFTLFAYTITFWQYLAALVLLWLIRGK